MNLTKTQNDFLQQELLDRSRDLIDAYYEEKNGFGKAESFGLSLDQTEAARIRRLAKDLTAVRVSTFLDVFRKFSKFPDSEEY